LWFKEKKRRIEHKERYRSRACTKSTNDKSSDNKDDTGESVFDLEAWFQSDVDELDEEIFNWIQMPMIFLYQKLEVVCYLLISFHIMYQLLQKKLIPSCTVRYIFISRTESLIAIYYDKTYHEPLSIGIDRKFFKTL